MKTLILKSDKGSFERVYIEYMKCKGVETEAFYKSKGEFFRLISVLYMQKLRLPLQSIWYGKWKKNIKKYDIVILFDRNYNWNIIEYIHKKNPKCRIIVWYWNPMFSLTRVPSRYRKLCEEWSFDKGDCIRLGINYNNQFTFKELFKNREEQGAINDIYFVGSDKGRCRRLHWIKQYAESEGFSTNFIIVKDETSADEYSDYSKPISYELNLKYLQESRCIIELNQENQDGLTVRCLEALFSQKKLITNNKSIEKYDFYKPCNIFIVDEENLSFEDIKKFLQVPYEPIDDFIIDNYDFISWYNHFFENFSE